MSTNARIDASVKLCPACLQPMQLLTVRYDGTGMKQIQRSWICHCGPVPRYFNEHL